VKASLVEKKEGAEEVSSRRGAHLQLIGKDL
jgi:hypothetical protein